MRLRAVSPCAGQSDGLNRDDATVLWHLVMFDDLEPGIGLHARDEIDASRRPVGEQRIVVVAAVIHHHNAGREGAVPCGPQ